VEAFDDRLIAVDEFHHVSATRQQARQHLGQFIARDRVHIVAMTGSYFRGDAEAVLAPAGRGEVRDRHLHLLRAAQRLRISEAARHRLFLLFGPYVDDILKVLDPA
jgi:superfamily II DNA or RNA helicase